MLGNLLRIHGIEKKVREEHLLNVMLPKNSDGLPEESPDECPSMPMSQ